VKTFEVLKKLKLTQKSRLTLQATPNCTAKLWSGALSLENIPSEILYWHCSALTSCMMLQGMCKF